MELVEGSRKTGLATSMLKRNLRKLEEENVIYYGVIAALATNTKVTR
jgi:DNA-binding HxlR family transcriptional regulator